MTRQIKDALLSQSIALPTGASSVNTAPIDLEQTSRADFVAGVDILIEAPILAVGELANGSTMTYTLQHDTDVAFGSAVDLYPGVLVQTGAGGNGAAAASKRVALPSDVKRYIRLRATNSAAANASAKSATIGLRF